MPAGVSQHHLGTDQGDRPGRWLDIPEDFAGDPDAVVTLAYPAAWNPTRPSRSTSTR
jgi:hypothetical protein